MRALAYERFGSADVLEWRDLPEPIPAAGEALVRVQAAGMNFADVYRFMEFAASLRDQTRLTMGEVTFDIESCRVIRDGS